MPLMLDDMRAAFAQHLSNDPAGRFRMDAAFQHAVEQAYRKGLEDGQFMAQAFTPRREPDDHEDAYAAAREAGENPWL